MKHTWVERIKMRMDELDMTQEILANKLDITRGAITHYLSGRRIPPLRQFFKLAQVLRVDPAWLQFGAVSESIQSRKEKEPQVTQKQLPLLSPKEVAGLICFTKEHRKYIKKWLPHYYTDQERWYALQIKSDSMTDVTGMRRSFCEGDYIIVDPEKQPEHKSYVVALLPKATEIIFRQYVIDGGVKYLKPLNHQYPIAKIEKGTVICGTVVGVYGEI